MAEFKYVKGSKPFGLVGDVCNKGVYGPNGMRPNNVPVDISRPIQVVIVCVGKLAPKPPRLGMGSTLAICDEAGVTTNTAVLARVVNIKKAEMANKDTVHTIYADVYGVWMEKLAGIENVVMLTEHNGKAFNVNYLPQILNPVIPWSGKPVYWIKGDGMKILDKARFKR